MGNIVNTVKRFSNNDAGAIPFQRCSNLPIGTSRLDKCTCVDNDSSVMGKFDSATKGSIDGCEVFYKDVGNDEMRLTTGSTSRTGCFGDINFLTLATAHTEQSGSDEANKDRETQNETIHTDARELGFVEHSEKAGLIYSQTADHMFRSLEDESTKTPRSLTLDISKDFLSKVSPERNCSRKPDLADDVENSRAIGIHNSKELRLHRVSPADSLFDSNDSEELVDGVLSFGCKSSPEALLEGLIHEKRTHHKSLSDDTVPLEVITACATLDVRGLESTPKASFKGRAKRKRTTTKASNRMLVPKESIGALVPSDVICLEILSEKMPTSPLVEQSFGDKVLQHTPRSRSTKTPLLYVHQSPFTRSKATALSISTPESMKRSRSGRLIVPRLDPGSQNIIYGPDGSIHGITNFEAQCPQGSNSEPPSKRRRRSQCLSPDHSRLLTF